MTNIGLREFYNCTGLTSVTIGNSVIEIGESSFEGCSGLSSISIPNSVTQISYKAFQNCSSLTDLTIEDGESTISFHDYSDSKRIDIFRGCPVKTLYLGRNIDCGKGRYSPFYEVSTLESLNIGPSVNALTEKSFINSPELKIIKVDALLPPSATRDCFNENSYLSSKLYVPERTKSKYEVLDPWCLFLELDITENYKPIESETPKNPSIEVAPTEVELTVGDTFELKVKIKDMPDDAIITWKSDNEFVATVDNNGTINAIADGIATITATCDNLTASCTVTIQPKTDSIIEVEGDGAIEVYDLKGVKVAESLDGLAKGIYIVRQGAKVSKIAI